MLWYILTSIAVSHVSAISKDYCPASIPKDRWTLVHGDKCYRFELDIYKEFNDAATYCDHRGGSLVSIKSKEINDYITEQLINTFDFHGVAWIGLHDMIEENQFVWIDGGKLDYSNFAENEGPRSGWRHLIQHHVEDCVAIDIGSNGKWRDYKCDAYLAGLVNEDKQFICEFQVKTPKTTKTPTTTTTTTTTSTTTTPTPTTGCPELICIKNCGMSGYKLDSNSCTICECEGEEPASAPKTIKTPTTTTRATPAPTTGCPELKCTKNCGMSGYKVDSNSCTICECQDAEPALKQTSAPTTSKTPTTTTRATPAPTTGCPELKCTKNCGMSGYKVDSNSCTICECQDAEPALKQTSAPTTSKTPTTTTRATPAPTTGCPELKCTKNCGMSGYKVDSNSCTICECQDAEPALKQTSAPTTSKTPTTTTRATPAPTTGCPELKCTKNCGMRGYKVDSNSCTLCECQDALKQTSAPKRVCKDLKCELNCNLQGFKTDNNGCMLCECDI